MTEPLKKTWSLKAFTDKRDMRAIATLAFVHGVILLCGLGSSVIWTRMMSPESFGEFRLVLSVLAFVGGFCLLGTGQAALMSASQGMDGNFNRLLASRLWANLAGSGGLLAAAAYYWRDGNSDVALALAIAAVLFPSYNLSDFWISWLNGKRAFGELSAARAVNAAIPVFALVMAVLIDTRQTWVVILILMLAIGVQNVTRVFRSRNSLQGTQSDLKVLAYGHHNSIAMAFSSLLALDVIILERWHSPIEVASYAVALQLPSSLKGLISIFGQVLAPRVYEQTNVRDAWVVIRRPFFALQAGFILIGLVGFFWLEPIMIFLFTREYSAAIELSRWLWLATCITGPAVYLVPLLASTKRLLFVYGPYVGFPLVTVALALVFVSNGPKWLIIGRIITLSLFYILYCIGVAWCVARREAHSRDS